MWGIWEMKISLIRWLTILITIHSLSIFAKAKVVTDMMNRKVSVPDSVTRIACIGRGSLRMICYLRAADLVAGVEYPERKKTSHRRPYLLAYPHLMELPFIGSGAKGDPELLVKANPQIIFYADGDLQALTMMQEKTGIPVVGIHCGNLTDNFKTFKCCLGLLSNVLKRQTRCDSLLDFIENKIDTLKRIGTQNQTKKLSAYIGGLIFKGRHGIQSTQVNYPPFQLAGLRNAASNLKGKKNKPVQINMEQLILWNPEMIFIDKGCTDLVYKDINHYPLLKSLNAVKDNRLFELYPSRQYGENFESTLVNAIFVSHLLSDEKFIQCEKEIQKVYSIFLTKNVYPQMIEFYGSITKF